MNSIHPLADTNDRVISLFRGGDHSPEAEDQFVRDLHASDQATSRLALYVMTKGIKTSDIDDPRSDGRSLTGGQVLSFAGACIRRNRTELLRKVIESGPPEATATLLTRTNNRMSLREWTRSLGCIYSKDKQDYRSTTNVWSLYRLATEPLGPATLESLRLAFQFAGDTEDAEHISSPNSVSQPGSIHYTVLHKAIHGEAMEPTCDAMMQQVPESVECNWAAGGKKLVTPADMACLKLLIDAKAPIHRVAGEPLDAGAFILTIRPPGQWEDIRAVMRMYIDRGLLDVDRPLGSSHSEPTARGHHPLGVAIRCGNGGAAAAFIDAGCSLDMKLLDIGHMHESYQAGIIEYSGLLNDAATTAAISQAIMRRQIASGLAQPHLADSTESAKRNRRTRYL